MQSKKNLFIAVLFFCVVFFQNAIAADSPGSRLHATVDKVLLLLKDPAYANPATRASVRSKIETQIRTIFDFDEFSARTAGKNWTAFTPDQKKRFDDAFAELLLVTYLDKVEGYNGEQVVYSGEVLSAKGDHAEVQTVVTLSDGKKVPVVYRMLLKNNWVVYDVLIENISLIKNYRSQFKDLLDRGTADQLIERVISRTQELRAENARGKK